MTYNEYFTEITTLLRNAGVKVESAAKPGNLVCTGKNGIPLNVRFYVTPAGKHKISYVAQGTSTESTANTLSAFWLATQGNTVSYTLAEASGLQEVATLPAYKLPQQLTFGKYQGKTFAEVAALNTKYLSDFVLVNKFAPEVKRAARIALNLPDIGQAVAVPPAEPTMAEYAAFMMPIFDFDRRYYSKHRYA